MELHSDSHSRSLFLQPPTPQLQPLFFMFHFTLSFDWRVSLKSCLVYPRSTYQQHASSNSIFGLLTSCLDVASYGWYMMKGEKSMVVVHYKAIHLKNLPLSLLSLIKHASFHPVLICSTTMVLTTYKFSRGQMAGFLIFICIFSLNTKISTPSIKIVKLVCIFFSNSNFMPSLRI